MASRDTPSRRVPGNPLAGILRALAQQARYSDRRRSAEVPTVISPASQAAVGDDATGVADSVTPVADTEAGAFQHDPLTGDAAEAVAALELAEDVLESEPVTLSQVYETLAATAVTDGTGSVTVTYGPYDTAPVVTATLGESVAGRVTVDYADGTSATVAVTGASGSRLSGVTVYVAAHVIQWSPPA